MSHDDGARGSFVDFFYPSTFYKASVIIVNPPCDKAHTICYVQLL